MWNKYLGDVAQTPFSPNGSQPPRFLARGGAADRPECFTLAEHFVNIVEAIV